MENTPVIVAVVVNNKVFFGKAVLAHFDVFGLFDLQRGICEEVTVLMF